MYAPTGAHVIPTRRRRRRQRGGIFTTPTFKDGDVLDVNDPRWREPRSAAAVAVALNEFQIAYAPTDAHVIPTRRGQGRQRGGILTTPTFNIGDVLDVNDPRWREQRSAAAEAVAPNEYQIVYAPTGAHVIPTRRGQGRQRGGILTTPTFNDGDVLDEQRSAAAEAVAPNEG